MVPWPSGEASVCKTEHSSSILLGTSLESPSVGNDRGDFFMWMEWGLRSLHGLCRHALRGALRVFFGHACRYAPYVVNQGVSASRRLMLHPCLGLLARHGVPRSYLRGAEALWLTAYGAVATWAECRGEMWEHRGACASAPSSVSVGTCFAVHFVCVFLPRMSLRSIRG